MVSWQTRIWFASMQWVAEHQAQTVVVGGALLHPTSRALAWDLLVYNFRSSLAFRGRTAVGSSRIVGTHLGRTRVGAAAAASMSAYPLSWIVGGTIAVAAIGAGVYTYYLTKYGLLGPEAQTMYIADNPVWRKANPDDPLAKAKINPFMISLGSAVS